MRKKDVTQTANTEENITNSKRNILNDSCYQRTGPASSVIGFPDNGQITFKIL